MSKIALTKRVSITMRGFSILKQYCPGLAQGKAAYELINSIQPFISVWFTAQIVNEISSQRRFNTILLFILGAVLLNFICSLLKNILNLDLCQYFEHKKLKGYADFFNSSSSFCCGVI